MTYFAMTQGTTEWLLGKPSVLDALNTALWSEPRPWVSLRNSEFVEGPLRMSASGEGEIVAFWNADYILGTGEESWGFVKLTDEMGLEARPDISREVLERCAYVINQRLQGLMIDGAFIHRAYDNGAHTCLAGRGSVARHVSIGYFESNVDTDQGPAHSILCLGPAFEFNVLASSAAKEGRSLRKLVGMANELAKPGRKRQVAPGDVLVGLRTNVAPFARVEAGSEYKDVEVFTDSRVIERQSAYQTLGLTYTDWARIDSPLTDIQRKILNSNAIERHPLRIVGPGGSGKTLLMQLLALRQLALAKDRGRPVRVLYVAHNSAMAAKVSQRFGMLELDRGLYEDDSRELTVTTLAEYGLRTLNLPFTAVIDPDAEQSKKFQLEQVTLALEAALGEDPSCVRSSALFSAVRGRPEVMPVLALLIMVEISTAIKGHGLENDKRRYVQSERKLSRLHGLLSQDERSLVFRVFQLYHKAVFEELEVLDSDDIALSLLGKLRTPIWELQRRQQGHDYVFVDETQLFNENERRVLPLLTRGTGKHVPIVLALDEAQDIYAQSSAGLATLGMPNIASESLGSIHRSTRAIVRLAFFIIQRSTDLFGPDFPDFTQIADKLEPDNHPLAADPRVDVVNDDSRSIGRFTLKKIRELRKANLRQVAIICHSDLYWDSLLNELRGAGLPLYELTQRGVRLPVDQPLVVLSKPAYVGGQEFDAVVLVGLEQGVVPPRIADNAALSAAIEQQTLREMYLSITRARYRLSIIISASAAPSPILAEAERAGLLTRANNG